MYRRNPTNRYIFINKLFTKQFYLIHVFTIAENISSNVFEILKAIQNSRT